VTFPKDLVLTIEVKDLLTKLLAKEPQERIGFKGGLAEILQHPWFRDVSLSQILERKM